MTDELERRVKLAAAYCGPFFVLTYMFCFAILGHNIPPPKMIGVSAQEFVDGYYGRYPEIGIGMVLACMAGALYMPWTCLLASILREAEGRMGMLSLMELSGGILTTWLLCSCPAFWAACSVMVGHVDPEVILLLHIATWITYDCTVLVTSIQVVCLGLFVILTPQVVFPKWVGWSSLAVSAVYLPLVLMPFTGLGPFAVNGVWNFFIVFGSWMAGFFIPISYYLLRYLKADAPPAGQRRGEPLASA